MNLLFISILISITALQSQQIDYNTKKGFVANGYDVVSYFNGLPIKGNKRFITNYDGAKYQFSSQKNLELFNKNQKKYIPQYGGYCAYAIGAKSKKVGINPETYKISNGKLYLFYNAWGTNTLNFWLKDLKALQQNADKNWERIKLKN